MRFKTFSFIIFIAILVFTAFFISTTFRRSSENGTNLSPFGRFPVGGELKISTSTLNLPVFEETATTSEKITEKILKPDSAQVSKPAAKPVVKNTIIPSGVQEVSAKSFEELINSSVVQLYCGYLGEGGMTFSDISRGTGIIFNAKGEILTNRHVIYDENSKKVRSDCFILKSPFPNEKSQNPKIYYQAEIISYPAAGKLSDSFSQDKYYNDFAVLKIASKANSESKINLLLGFDYAVQTDYLILESGTSTFNFLPIDWNYQPKDGNLLITLGYGVDASHIANKITSTIGELWGNVSIDGSSKPQILLIGSNATIGFSGGALINPWSKGFVGLISWITSGDETGKYTVAIFRDFLKTLMLQDLNFELK